MEQGLPDPWKNSFLPALLGWFFYTSCNIKRGIISLWGPFWGTQKQRKNREIFMFWIVEKVKNNFQHCAFNLICPRFCSNFFCSHLWKNPQKSPKYIPEVPQWGTMEFTNEILIFSPSFYLLFHALLWWHKMNFITIDFFTSILFHTNWTQSSFFVARFHAFSHTFSRNPPTIPWGIIFKPNFLFGVPTQQKMFWMLKSLYEKFCGSEKKVCTFFFTSTPGRAFVAR